MGVWNNCLLQLYSDRLEIERKKHSTLCLPTICYHYWQFYTCSGTFSYGIVSFFIWLWPLFPCLHWYPWSYPTLPSCLYMRSTFSLTSFALIFNHLFPKPFGWSSTLPLPPRQPLWKFLCSQPHQLNFIL